MYHQQIFILVTVLTSCALAQLDVDIRERHPDVGLRVPELVEKYKYPLESYEVKTEDDYLLTVHRIPHGKNNAYETKKPVVFLQHGLLCSSADWVLMGPEKGLAYILADLGYDVWMGNARGNTYSRKHKNLDPDKNKKNFWNFSWHEIGMKDLPAMINFVLEKTKEEKIFYIGHSQGTTSFFVMASSLPEYNDKIRLMVALAPVAFMGHVPNYAVKLMAKLAGVAGWVAKMLGAYEFLPSTEFMQELSAFMCDEESIVQGLCSNILFLIAGYDKEQLNKTMIPVILSNTPAGSATNQFLHYAHGINSKEFRQFDYGLLNCLHYKFCKPPNYQLEKITAPVALYSGKNDLMTAKKDIDQLHESLPHSIRNKQISYDQFSHLDFLWANDVVKLLYNDVIDLIQRYH